MKAHFKTATGRLTFEVEGESPKALFKKLAVVQEIFDSDKECGCCHGTDIRFRARQVDDYEFFEIACGDCFARLQFGQAKKGGGLFPKRKAEDGSWLPNRGWAKWEKPGSKSEPVTQDAPTDRIDDDDVPF